MSHLSLVIIKTLIDLNHNFYGKLIKKEIVDIQSLMTEGKCFQVILSIFIHSLVLEMCGRAIKIILSTKRDYTRMKFIGRKGNGNESSGRKKKTQCNIC